MGNVINLRIVFLSEAKNLKRWKCLYMRFFVAPLLRMTEATLKLITLQKWGNLFYVISMPPGYR